MAFTQDRLTGKNFATRAEVIAKNGMVATSQPLATQVGLDILKKGGSAIDAAIAANAALGLMEPTGCGMGGDLFAIVWDAKTKQLYGLNASGRSPKSLKLAYFKEKGMAKIPSHGPLPVSVPGAVDGWFELHQKFGKLSMKENLAPAIQYAKEGFPLTQYIAALWGNSVPFYLGKGFPNVKETYTIDGKGKVPQKGDVFKNPYLANTLTKIAEGGRDAYYKGDIARTIADFIQAQGGFLAYEDFASHKSEWVDPVSTNYRGYDVWELPPNGQGITALQMLNILEQYDFSKIPFGSDEHIHYFVEAKKLAFEDRAKYYADMDFADVNVDHLISKEYGKERQALITERAGQYEAGQISAGETIYLTTAEFSLVEGQANTYEPGKRPFHTIIPAFITKDGKPYMSFGVMGGDFQPMGHCEIVMNMIDWGMNIQEAGDAPRIDHTGSSTPTGKAATGKGKIRLESGFDYETIRQLMVRGHEVGFGLGIYGGYQAIMYDAERGVYFGASESRKDGQAAGY